MHWYGTGGTVIRWWVSSPVNQDLYLVFVVRRSLEGVDFYWHGGKWVEYNLGDIIQPALEIPGLLAAQMAKSGREDVPAITRAIQNLADEIWISTTMRKEPA